MGIVGVLTALTQEDGDAAVRIVNRRIGRNVDGEDLVGERTAVLCGGGLRRAHDGEFEQPGLVDGDLVLGNNGVVPVLAPWQKKATVLYTHA